MSTHTKLPLIVMKFGGTSVGSAERIQAVAQLVAGQAKTARVVVVVSAMSGVTDMLIRAATAAGQGEDATWQSIEKELGEKHLQVIEKILPAGEQKTLLPWLAEQTKVLDKFCSGFSMIREVTPRAMDMFSSLGEVLSAPIVAAALRAGGSAAESLDSADLIVTDGHFGNAAPDFKETNQRIGERLAPVFRRGAIPVVTGFRGATREGLPTTLGRGASDYVATIIAGALDTSEVQIWTDVDGVMTADPRIVQDAKIIPEISYKEAIELSFFGAKVLHSQTIQPVMDKKVPVWTKNTFNPSCPGTKIGPSVAARPGIKAVTSVTKANFFTVTGRDSISFPNVAAKIFGALSLEDVSTLMITQASAENVISFAIHAADGTRVRRRLETAFELEMRHDYMAGIEVMPDIGVVVGIGENMKGTPGIAGRMFGALGRNKINIIAIAQGSSELSISAAVKSSDVPAAIKAVHEEFRL